MDFSEEDGSALSISKGKESPGTINPKLTPGAKSRRRKHRAPREYLEKIRAGDRTILSQAITLVESSHPDDLQLAQELIHECLPYTGQALRVGITGVPGVGKSAFIESLGTCLCDEHNRSLAVLAVDPTSQLSKGSILGDKTRMTELSTRENVFIRPSPSAGALGGVAEKSRETIFLCETAGFDTIFVETVGVGQSETTVHGMVDFFLLMILPGAGDELQGIKRGIMEMADGIAIAKADGINVKKAQLARQEYANALHLFPPSPYGWTPRVITTSAINRDGIGDVWDMILDYERLLKDAGAWEEKRKRQLRSWMYDSIWQNLQSHFHRNAEVKKALETIESDVLDGKRSPFEAAQALMRLYHAKG